MAGKITDFEINSAQPKIKFTALFGDGPAVVTDGYGGWQITSRPREIGITEWAGRNPMAIDIPFMIDNFTDFTDEPGVETETMVTRLERLCGLGSHDQPPICTIDADGAIPHDHHDSPALRWVVENVAWDRDIEFRNEHGNRIRCGGVITVRQYIEARDIMRRISGNARAVKPTIYIVKKGDTLSKIAAQKLGDANKWKVIADANNLRDPRSLAVGQHLRIPMVGSTIPKKK